MKDLTAARLEHQRRGDWPSGLEMAKGGTWIASPTAWNGVLSG
jgi:hypothetical protein